MARFLAAAMAVLLGGAATAADHGLHTQGMAATAHVGERDLGAARLELVCRGGPGGTLALRLVLPAAAAKAFPLDDFEGPDGVGGSRALAQWSVDTRGPTTRLASSIGGWYDEAQFILATEAPRDGKSSPLAGVVRALVGEDAQRLRLSLAAPSGGAVLQAEALVADARADLRRAAADCLGTD